MTLRDFLEPPRAAREPATFQCPDQHPRFRPKFLSFAIAAAILIPGQNALAQDETLEEIQVTGSRIQRPGMTSPVPVTAISADELASVRWVNMRASWTHETDAGTSWQLFGNVQNLLGDDPPIFAGNVGRGLPGGASGMHQTLAVGRAYTFGLNVNF
jgi:outer membrane receptor protein involved in Fe transport